MSSHGPSSPLLSLVSDSNIIIGSTALLSHSLSLHHNPATIISALCAILHCRICDSLEDLVYVSETFAVPNWVGLDASSLVCELK